MQHFYPDLGPADFVMVAGEGSPGSAATPLARGAGNISGGSMTDDRTFWLVGAGFCVSAIGKGIATTSGWRRLAGCNLVLVCRTKRTITARRLRATEADRWTAISACSLSGSKPPAVSARRAGRSRLCSRRRSSRS